MRASSLLWSIAAMAYAQTAPDAAGILKQVRATALNYTQSLPNYVCTQITRRHIDPLGTENWTLADTIQEQLTFVDHKEAYSALTINGTPAKNLRHEQLSGSESTGEFGTLLYEIFDPATDAAFVWDRADTLRGDPVQVFTFRVPQVRSKYTVYHADSGRRLTPGYHGAVWIDPKSDMVMRIHMETDGIPADFPVQSVALDLNYGFVKIGDHPFLLPLKSDVHARQGLFLSWNEIEFRGYRRFGADATITFDTSKKP